MRGKKKCRHNDAFFFFLQHVVTWSSIKIFNYLALQLGSNVVCFKNQPVHTQF